MEIEAELRVASDRILHTLEQLDTLETEKRTLDPDSERFQTLAREIERLAAEIFAQSHNQSRLGQEAKAATETTGEIVPPINESKAARELPTILAEWRDAERRLQAGAADSAERAIASGDVERLREEYQKVYSASKPDKSTD